MDWKKVTKVFTTVIVLVIGVYDIIAAAFGGADSTLSRFVGDWPSVSMFALGYVMGHITWPQYTRK